MLRVLLGICFFTSSLLQAQVPLQLLRDINTTPQNVPSSPDIQIAGLHEKTFFVKDDVIRGHQLWVRSATGNLKVLFESLMKNTPPRNLTAVGDLLYFNVEMQLWKTNGTIEGTGVVATIPGTKLYRFAAYNELLTFNVSGFDNGIWRSDGTASGTYRLGTVKTADGPTGGQTDIQVPIPFKGELYFTGEQINQGLELWKTNGTTGGTLQVANIFPGNGSAMPTNYAVAGDVLYFRANEPSTGTELWRSDGTAAGTYVLKDISPGISYTSLANFVGVNDTFYFTVEGPFTETTIWKSGGTEASTFPVITFPISATHLGSFTALGSKLLFARREINVTGRELWASDGTAAGTQLVRDVLLGPESGLSTIPNMVVIGDLLYFKASNATNSEIWSSDGTFAGTQLVVSSSQLASDGTGLIKDVTKLENRIAFLYNDEHKTQNCWSYAPAAGITKLTDFSAIPGYSWPSDPVFFNGFHYFVANDETHGYELWRTNLSNITELFYDVNPGPASGATGNMKVIGTLLYFVANNGVNGSELWKTDGLAGSTQMVKDIYPGAADSEISIQGTYNGQLLFRARNDEYAYELWISDGTEPGTVMVGDLVPGPTGSYPSVAMNSTGEVQLINGRFLINGSDGTQPVLWSSDGTSAGTAIVKTFANGIGVGTYVRNNMLFISMNSYYPTTVNELWVGDGTAAGMSLLKQFPLSGTDYNITFGFTEYKGLVYFTAKDMNAGFAVWRTDGTPAGTTMYFDPLPGYQFVGGPSNYKLIGDKLLFMFSQSPLSELWSADGVNTPVKMPIYPGTFDGNGFPFLVYKDHLVTTATDGTHGYELWKSDGTVAGTQLIRDIVPGSGSSTIQIAMVVGDDLYFTAKGAGINLWQIWKTDGTACRTQQMTNEYGLLSGFIWPGNENKFVVSILHPIYGREPMVYDRSLESPLLCRTQQSIIFPAIASKKFSDPAFPLNATSSSGLPAQYQLSNAEIISVSSGGTVTFLKTGQVLITSVQPGDATFEPAVDITQLLTVEKGQQSITFSPFDKPLSEGSTNLTATASSGLTVDFFSNNNKLSILGFTATFLNAGKANVTASQAGNGNYEPATIDQQFCIIPDKPTIQIQGEYPSVTLTSSNPDGNQWFFDGVLLAETGPSILVAEAGQYTLHVNIDGCISPQESGEISPLEEPLITSLSEELVVSVFPNPVTDVLEVRGSSGAEFEVYSITGQHMKSGQLSESNTIDLTELNNGLYFINLKLAGTNSTFKVIKK